MYNFQGRKITMPCLYRYVNNQRITIRRTQIYIAHIKPTKYYCAEMVAQPLFSTVQSVLYDPTKAISYPF